jgi:hypothetical protein
MVKPSHKGRTPATKPPAKGATTMTSKTKAKENINPADSMIAWGVYMIRDKIMASCSAGRHFKIDGFGTWEPALQPDGSVEVHFRPDEAMISALNAPYTFNALSEFTGKSSAELVELWNKDHPENPVPNWITVLDPE